MSHASAASRVRAFDWLRGLAVPFMIQCHAMVLLVPALRTDAIAQTLLWIDGLVAPSFLLAAGFALGLTQVRAARTADTDGVAARRWKTLRRIGEVLAVATLVNWMWFPLLSEPRWLFRIDILHCIGLSLLIAFAWLRFVAPTPRAVVWSGMAIAAAIFFAAPFGEAVTGPWAMLANKSTGAVFPLLPWTGYVFLGGAFGAIAATRGPVALAKSLGVMGAVTLVLWLCTPVLEHAYPPHAFGTFNPAEHARRLTVIAVVLAGLLHVEQRMAHAARSVPFRALELFGTTSLAAYFFHEALLFKAVFGFSFDAVWGDTSGWWKYTALTVLLVGVTWALCWGTDRVYRWVEQGAGRLLRPTPEPVPAAALASPERIGS